MGARWSRAAVIQDYQGKLHEFPKVIKEANRFLEEIALAGADEMKGYIANRGTGYSQSQGRSGRIESGTMYDAVQHRPNPNVANNVFSWEFGWIGVYLSYFGYQEKGFRHTGGTSVEPMYALRDASTTARDKMVALGPIILAKLKALMKV
jgi:hypothetical protein